jgi:hypothetical protein
MNKKALKLLDKVMVKMRLQPEPRKAFRKQFKEMYSQANHLERGRLKEAMQDYLDDKVDINTLLNG